MLLKLFWLTPVTRYHDNLPADNPQMRAMSSEEGMQLMEEVSTL